MCMPNELVGLYVEENPRSCLRAGDADKGGEDAVQKTVLAPILVYCQEGICQNQRKLAVRRFAQTRGWARRAEGQDARKIHCFGIVTTIGTTIGATSNP